MLPPYTGGFGIDVSWKGIGLTADFSWVAGNYLINNTLYFTENAYFAGWTMGQSTGALDYWKQPGDHAKYPRLDYSGNYGMEFDTHLLEKCVVPASEKNIQPLLHLPAGADGQDALHLRRQSVRGRPQPAYSNQIHRS
ncbi:MAG: hypothetical protein L6V35_08135 [Alistipes putredinis]|nr:MAG: hypothetical protein L6V35_08135 [Alistipes putredinis]